MVNLLVIHPGASHGIYGALGDDLVAVEPPLWCRLIAGFIRDLGFKVAILDAEALQLSPIAAAEYAVSQRPALICLAVYGHQPSASTQQMDGAGKTAKAIKALWPESKIIMVGGHVSALPARTIKEEAINYACVGEGPTTIFGLLAGDYNEDIPGLVYRDGKTTYTNDPAPLIELESLHGNAWDLLPMDKYRAHNWQCFGDLSKRQPYASIYTSLGCPYKCSFCCINSPFGTNRYRMRNPKDVVAEIGALFTMYGVKTYKIVDEMFVLNERHYTAICEGLIQTGLAPYLNIWAYARVDTVKPEKLALLRAAGIRWLALGIESGSAYVRDGSNKRLKNNDIKSVVRAIQAADINVIGNYIFGLPDDDLSSMLDTLNLAQELNTEFANFYSAMAYPGSPLYNEAVEKGWELPSTWKGYSQHNRYCRPLDTEHVSGAAVLATRDEAFRTYFGSQLYQDMVRKKFGNDTVLHIQKMLEYKLERDLLKVAA